MDATTTAAETKSVPGAHGGNFKDISSADGEENLKRGQSWTMFIAMLQRKISNNNLSNAALQIRLFSKQKHVIH